MRTKGLACGHLPDCRTRTACSPQLSASQDWPGGVAEATAGGSVRVCALPSPRPLSAGHVHTEKHLGPRLSGALGAGWGGTSACCRKDEEARPPGVRTPPPWLFALAPLTTECGADVSLQLSSTR